jgi:predicted porin
MKAVSPATNGLTGTAQISFAPDSSSGKVSGQNKGGGSIDMREVFFNVEGSFGTISVGRTLSLFSRGAILNDMTLFGVGASGGIDGGGTSLGRIGNGYTYAEFNTRFAWKSPDMSGFNVEIGIFDPLEGSGGNTANFETDTPQFQIAANYSTSFDGGSLSVWADGIYQEMSGRADAAAGFNTSGEVTTQGFGFGVNVAAGGVGLVVSMYDGEGLGSLRQVDTNSYQCTATRCTEAEADGYYIQATYNVSPATKVGVSYGESNQDNVSLTGAVNNTGDTDIERSIELTSFGVYHEVNSWLRVVGE